MNTLYVLEKVFNDPKLSIEGLSEPQVSVLLSKEFMWIQWSELFAAIERNDLPEWLVEKDVTKDISITFLNELRLESRESFGDSRYLCHFPITIIQQ